jgi:hypothetical protein
MTKSNGVEGGNLVDSRNNEREESDRKKGDGGESKKDPM